MNKEFLARVLRANEILTLQDRTLRTREDGPLISKARDPRESTRNLNVLSNVLSNVFGYVDFANSDLKYSAIIVKFAGCETLDLLTCAG